MQMMLFFREQSARVIYGFNSFNLYILITWHCNLPVEATESFKFDLERCTKVHKINISAYQKHFDTW